MPEIVLQRFPYPKYIEDPLLPALTSFVSTVVLLSYIYTAINTIKVISAEKEAKMKVGAQTTARANAAGLVHFPLLPCRRP